MTTETKLIINTCKQCGWQWAQHRTMKVSKISPVCPKCDSKYWDGDIRIEHKCQKCGHEWGGIDKPNGCPNCHSRLWGRDRKPHPKGENFNRALELRKTTPCLTLQEVGDKLDVSKERARQLLKAGGMPTKHYHYNSKYHCAKCGKKLKVPSQSGLCHDCLATPLVPLICDQCGVLFYRRQAQVLNPCQPHTGYYCSRQCYGKYVGQHYGGGRKKELVEVK